EDYRRRGARDNDFVVPFSTLSTNLISGGNAMNTVPALCEIGFEFRNLPREPLAAVEQRVRAYVETELLPAMRAELADAKVEITQVEAAPPFEGSEEAPITKLARALTGHHTVEKIAPTTEAGHFSGIAGVPTVVCGPHGGAIHCANEYITAAQLTKCREFLLKVAESLKAPPARL
ncbi:glutamamyl carboxypeptidase, partial [Trypanosoma conorhini]